MLIEVIYKIFRPATGLLLASVLTSNAPARDASAALDRPENAVNSLFHIGLWTEDLEEMQAFLTGILDLSLVSRSRRRTGGERVIFSDPRGQLIELLSDPGTVVPHPEFLLHPRGHVAGVAHLAIQVEDVVAIKDKLSAKGYLVISQVPEDFADGYMETGTKKYRILYVRGPDAVTFELFEIK